MPFGNLFKNPFEKLSAEAQDDMRSSLNDIADYLVDAGKNTIVQGLNVITAKLDVLIKTTDTIAKFLGAGKIKKEQEIDEKKLKAMGITARLMGEGMRLIVDAIKTFSKIDDKVVDRFVMAIEKIADAFKKMEPMANIITKAGRILIELAKGIILFGLAMIVALPIYVLAIPGAIVATTIILGFVYLFAKVLGDKDTVENIHKGAQALAIIGIAVILFGIGMLVVGAGVYMKLIDVATIVVFGVIIGFMLLFAWALGKVFHDGIYEGAKALAFMGIAVILFGLALLVSIPLYNYIFDQDGAGKGLGLIGMVILGAVGIFFILSLIKGNIIDGVKALMLMGAAIIILGLAIWIFSKFIANIENPWETLAQIGVALLGLATVLLIVGQVKQNVIMGALAMILATIPIIMLAFALKIWREADIKWETLGMVAAAITGLGAVMALAGIPIVAGFIALGAGAMILAAASLILITVGLKEFKKLDWDEADGENLMNAFESLSSAMLGGKMPGGLMAGIKFAAAAAARALLIFTTAPAFIFAGFALQSISTGLKYFKDAGFSAADGENMEEVFASIIKAFTLITDDKRKKELGITATWLDVFKGTIALQGVGNIMTQMASGVQSMANLNFIEYEVKRDANGNTKIQPKGVVKLTDADIENSAKNFGKIVDSIIGPISRVGMMEDASDGWFSDGYFSKGVEALSGAGGIMKDLALGVQSMANLTFTEFEIFTDKDGRKSIQPKSITKLSDKDMVGAGVAFGKIVDAIFGPIAKVGMAEDNSDGWFSDGIFKKGVDSLTGVGVIMTTMAEGVLRLANMEFISNEIYKDANGKTVVQPGKVVRLTPAHLKAAGINFLSIVDSMFNGMILAATKYGEHEDEFETLFDGWNDFNKVFKDLTKFATDWGNIPNPIMSGITVRMFIQSILDNFKKGGLFDKEAQHNFNIFSKTIGFLIIKQSQLDKVANSFDKMAESMGVMKDNINSMEIEKLKEVVKMFGFFDSLAKSDKTEDLVSKIGDVLKEGLDNLEAILQKIADINTGGNTTAATTTTTPATTTTATTTKVTPQQQQQIQQQNLQPLLTELQNISSILRGTLKVKDAANGLI